jgi:sporulation protein YlmC with PRC-barrel domain
MMDVKRAQDLIGNDVYDPDGHKIGRVRNVYVDDVTHQPEWVTVRAGLFGLRESFVPLAGGSITSENEVNVAVSRGNVKDAPRVDARHGHLSDQEGRELLDHYGIHQASSPRQHGGVPQQQQRAETTQTEQRRVAQQRAEQQRAANGENGESTGFRARESVTADQMRTVPINREEARIGGEPASSDEAGRQHSHDH